jgi:hypothetical protein
LLYSEDVEIKKNILSAFTKIYFYYIILFSSNTLLNWKRARQTSRLLLVAAVLTNPCNVVLWCETCGKTYFFVWIPASTAVRGISDMLHAWKRERNEGRRFMRRALQKGCFVDHWRFASFGASRWYLVRHKFVCQGKRDVCWEWFLLS